MCGLRFILYWCLNPFTSWEIYLTSVVWTCHTFENNFRIKHKFAKYLKESCRLSSDEQIFFKYLLNISFVREILTKLSGGFGCYRRECVEITGSTVVFSRSENCMSKKSVTKFPSYKKYRAKNAPYPSLLQKEILSGYSLHWEDLSETGDPDNNNNNDSNISTTVIVYIINATIP